MEGNVEHLTGTERKTEHIHQLHMCPMCIIQRMQDAVKYQLDIVNFN